MSKKFIIGIDEAGRGPLAGPVSVGVVAIQSDFDMDLLRMVRDSKQLSPIMREVWREVIRRASRTGVMRHSVTLISNISIDRIGIVPSIQKAMNQSLQKLDIHPAHTEVFLDGGLKAPAEYRVQQTIIKGDEKVPLIGLASIMAKTERDHYMIKIAAKYPAYGFEVHKGYGTKNHREIIAKKGLSPLHRASFCRAFY